MYYIDTSVIVAYYCPEALSDKAEDFLSKIDRPNISSLTECHHRFNSRAVATG
jgi:predicted nucleic acid-binding protein